MIIAVDIDGTLTRETENLKKLMTALVEAGHRVICLTGSLGDKPTQEERVKQLSELGLEQGENYTEIVRSNGLDPKQVAENKAKFCKKNKIDMVFEDDDMYISMINGESPKTTTWLVRRWA